MRASFTGVLVAFVGLVLPACDSASKGDAAAPKAGAAKADAPAAGASPGAGDESVPDAAKSHIELSLSSGETLSATPTKCSIDPSGKGVVEADDGKFTLTFEGSAGTVKWTHSGGTLDQATAVTVSGSAIGISGLIDGGGGYNAEITCK